MLISKFQESRKILLIFDKADSDYIIHFYYEYDIELNVLNMDFSIYKVSSKGYETNEEVDDLDEFFYEKGLSLDYMKEQQNLKLDEFLDHWFDMNNGLSRFGPDDLGDFTIEYDY